MIRLLIADDQALVRAGLRLIVESEPDCTVVGEAADGEAAIRAVAECRPDVVMMDVRMPGVDGIEATRRLNTASDSAPPVLVLTTFEDDAVLWGAIDAGAAGFVLKDTPADDLIKAIRATAGGGSWLDPRVTPRVLARVRAQVPSTPAPVIDLSARELEVLRLMAAGSTNGEIAARLYLAERTVKSHIGSIFTKLGARDRTAAILFAFRSGVIDPRSP
ncbi:MAG: LuxR family transcriptional regulator [Ilumatobacteraceae bacterium]|nr:LuxR family transcriptional regulator [Ilumatobacteraceae bacterium]MCU1387943.1 LuxR family transcriptional regulator [Ilumatobacteraceae bacterium]